MDIQKAIVKFDGLFNTCLIDRIIHYLNFEKSLPLSTLGGDTEKIRKVKGFSVVNKYHTHVDNKDMTKHILFNFIKQSLKIPLLNYTVKFRECVYEDIVQTDFLTYDVNGKYEIHVDDCPQTTRRLSIIVNLNEGYEGGDFIFFDPINKKDIIHRESLKKGTILIFPSNFLYPHSIEPITKGTRYSLVSWAT
jgi:predicted 2-oxoglutarate/Fe(II)-dependent dioxygenase YbiX